MALMLVSIISNHACVPVGWQGGYWERVCADSDAPALWRPPAAASLPSNPLQYTHRWSRRHGAFSPHSPPTADLLKQGMLLIKGEIKNKEQNSMYSNLGFLFF